jgi:hypothetical protein
MTARPKHPIARGAAVSALALVLVVSMLATVVLSEGTSDEAPAAERDDGLTIPEAKDDTAPREPVTERTVIDRDEDGVADGASWTYERHIRIDRDGDGNYEYAMDLVIKWTWLDPDHDGVINYFRYSLLFREYFDPNDDGVREVVRGHKTLTEVTDKDGDRNPELVKVDDWNRLVIDVRAPIDDPIVKPDDPVVQPEEPVVQPEDPDATVRENKEGPIVRPGPVPVPAPAPWLRWHADGVPEYVNAWHKGREVVDRNDDGNPEYAKRVNEGRKAIDANSDRNPELVRAHINYLELFDKDSDGRWDAAHHHREGKLVIDRDSDGTPERVRTWCIDDWYYRDIPRVVAEDELEETEGDAETPVVEAPFPMPLL